MSSISSAATSFLGNIDEDEQQRPSTISFLPPSIADTHHPSHLTPCTYDEYLQLSDSTRDQYDLVSCHLVYNPKMSDVDHLDIVKSITYYLMKAIPEQNDDAYIYSEAKTYIPSRQKALEDLLNSTKSTSDESIQSQHPSSQPSTSSSPKNTRSNSPSPTSSPASSSKSGEGIRKSDICVFRSAPKIGPDEFFDKDCAPAMIIEVTSNAESRSKDFGPNWRQYYRAGVELYIIVDRDKPNRGKRGHRPCVIVGKSEHSSWARSFSGDPREETKEHGTRRGLTSSDLTFHRRIYDKNDNTDIDCMYLKLKARQMLNPPKMEFLIKQDHNKAKQKDRDFRNHLQVKDTQLQVKDTQLQKAKLTERDLRNQIKGKDDQLKGKDDQIERMKSRLKRFEERGTSGHSPPRKVLRDHK